METVNRDESQPGQLTKDWENLHSLLVLERMLDKQLDRLESEYQWNCRKYVYLRALDCEASQLQVLATKLQRSRLVSLMLRSALEETFLEKNRLADILRHQQLKWTTEDPPSCAPHEDQDRHQLMAAPCCPVSGEYIRTQLKGETTKLPVVIAQCAGCHRPDSKNQGPGQNSPSVVGVQNLSALHSSARCVPSVSKRLRMSLKRKESRTAYIRDSPYYCLSKERTVLLKISNPAWSKRVQHRCLSLRQFQEDRGRTKHNHLLCRLDRLSCKGERLA